MDFQTNEKKRMNFQTDEEKQITRINSIVDDIKKELTKKNHSLAKLICEANIEKFYCEGFNLDQEQNLRSLRHPNFSFQSKKYVTCKNRILNLSSGCKLCSQQYFYLTAGLRLTFTFSQQLSQLKTEIILCQDKEQPFTDCLAFRFNKALLEIKENEKKKTQTHSFEHEENKQISVVIIDIKKNSLDISANGPKIVTIETKIDASQSYYLVLNASETGAIAQLKDIEQQMGQKQQIQSKSPQQLHNEDIFKPNTLAWPIKQKIYYCILGDSIQDPVNEVIELLNMYLQNSSQNFMFFQVLSGAQLKFSKYLDKDPVVYFKIADTYEVTQGYQQINLVLLPERLEKRVVLRCLMHVLGFTIEKYSKKMFVTIEPNVISRSKQHYFVTFPGKPDEVFGPADDLSILFEQNRNLSLVDQRCLQIKYKPQYQCTIFISWEQCRQSCYYCCGKKVCSQCFELCHYTHKSTRNPSIEEFKCECSCSVYR